VLLSEVPRDHLDREVKMNTFGRIAGRMRVSRRVGVLAFGLVVVVAVAGGALASDGPSSKKVLAMAFYANTISDLRTSTCTAANSDVIKVTEATYTGSAAGIDAQLNGPITIHARSVYDTVTNVGTVSGDMSINNPATFTGQFTAVSALTTTQGWVNGQMNGVGNLIGSFSTTFRPDSGFAGPDWSNPATLGAGIGINIAVATTSGCPGQNGQGQNG
jgi:hypothetical protein